jgi:N-acetylneuraminic acid mutarotase
MSTSLTPLAAPSGSTKLAGTLIGTAGSFQNKGNTIANAVDGNVGTFFDAPTANGDWVGLDLGTPAVITQVQFAPRAGWAARMVGGIFQGSISSDFSAGVTNLFTITATPPVGSYTIDPVNGGTAFEYVRYLAPAGAYGNIAELEFDGMSDGAAPVGAGTTSPTPNGPWGDLDIGAVGPHGSASFQSGGPIIVTGSGADVWGETDGFNFDYQPFVGNGSIIAEVASQSDSNSWAKSGIMIRESDNVDSRFVLVALTPGNGVVMEVRTATHVDASVLYSTPLTAGVTLELMRNGDSFTGYTFTNATGWNELGSVTIPMVNNVLAGMAVTAHDNSTTSTGTFENVSISPSGSTASNWSDGAASPLSRWESGTVTYHNQMYVFGGFTDRTLDATAEVDRYDPATNTWSQVTTIPTGGLTHEGITLVGATVYLAGGNIGSFEDYYTGDATSQVLTYNMITGKWGSVTPLPIKITSGGLVCINNHLIYFGGINAASTVDLSHTWSLNLGDPSAGWVTEANMPNARNHIGYAAINGIAYAVGGEHLYNQVGGNTASVDAYNPVTNTWKAVASLPFPWSGTHGTTIVVNGKIVIVGGQTNGGYDGIYLNNIDEYDPASNSWSAVGTTPEANQGEADAYINGELIVADGTVDNLGGWGQDQTWLDSDIVL